MNEIKVDKNVAALKLIEILLEKGIPTNNTKVTPRDIPKILKKE